VRAAPDATVVFAERARHFVMLDDPELYFAELEPFLERARAKAAADDTAADGASER
jgi:hypothetical protein